MSITTTEHRRPRRARRGVVGRGKRRVRPGAGAPPDPQTPDDASRLFAIHALRMGSLRAPGITAQVS